MWRGVRNALLVVGLACLPTSCGITSAIKRVDAFVEKNESRIQSIVETVATLSTELPKIIEKVKDSIGELQKFWTAVDANKDGERSPDEWFKALTGGSGAALLAGLYAVWRRKNKIEARLEEDRDKVKERNAASDLARAAKFAELERELLAVRSRLPPAPG